jgi:hypothetical protein
MTLSDSKHVMRLCRPQCLMWVMLRDSVVARIAKLGSRFFDPMAFFITRDAESGPTIAISGTSGNLITGIVVPPCAVSRNLQAARHSQIAP